MRYFLENENLGLRPLSEDDVSGGYGDWFNDAEICKYNDHHRFPMTDMELSGYIESLKSDHSKIVLAVCEKENNVHIGNISLQEIDLINRQAEIAFVFGNKDYWGKGFATEAARLLIGHAFSELGLNRIYFGTSKYNKGMQKVGEKLSFKQTGILRQAVYKHGEFVDIYQYDLLRDEWSDDVKTKG